MEFSFAFVLAAISSVVMADMAFRGRVEEGKGSKQKRHIFHSVP